MQRQIRCECSLQGSMAWMGIGSSPSMGCNDQSCEVAYKQIRVLQGRRKGEPAWEGACPSVPRQWTLTSPSSDPLPRIDRSYHPPLKSGMLLVQSFHLVGLKIPQPRDEVQPQLLGPHVLASVYLAIIQGWDLDFHRVTDKPWLWGQTQALRTLVVQWGGAWRESGIPWDDSSEPQEGRALIWIL